MRVFKNLFGNGSKINASEVVTKNAAGEVTALDLLGVECGSNANGEWVRFNFGLQMCWIVKPAWPGAVADTAWGNIYRSSTQFTWSYPKNFIDNPFLAGGGSGSVSVVFSGSTGRSNTESMVFRTERASASTTDPDIWLVAIGWWKTPGT